MRLYRLATFLLTPVMPLWIMHRKRRGKEDAERWGERFGIPSYKRPDGTLLWIHAASVGEANSVLLLIRKILERFPQVNILVTTGTVTSAAMMKKRLPPGAFHQYAPIDTPGATERFIRHWKPDIAFWVESEFWPNLIEAANRNNCFMGVVNGRMSDRSYRAWKKRPKLIRDMLMCFDIVFAQSDEDAERLLDLGAKLVLNEGNLKFDAAMLPCDESELTQLKNSIGVRPVWLAASTHPGEEAMVAEAHNLLAATRPNLLTVIVPRHPERGTGIADGLRKSLRVKRRSKKEDIGADTQIYIADTLGELGLFYRLCEIVFMGGSLVKHGGQNPLEPARLACALTSGPHTENFADIYQELQTIGGCIRVTSASNLAAQVDLVMNNANKRAAMQSAVKPWVEKKSGAAGRVMDMLAPIFNPGKKPA